MKPIHWVLGGVGVGAAVTFLYFYEPSLQHESGYDSVEEAANQAWKWGSKTRASGGGRRLEGKLKEGVGRVTANDDLAGEGVLDQVTGTVKDAAGQPGHAVGRTIHDLNL
jgi:uncharacterized protein YjbJ (UPF0337 family)